ncbi:MAG: lipoate--protein ligase family protein [Chitinophagaceae bacterium]|nr:lipoate--protein ligase family protein [Anaerolineae bacterium]
MRQWHLIYDTPTDGIRNMAVDEAILTSVRTGEAPPTLRLYAWSPPYVSLGYGQSISDVDLERLDTLGWGLVRRMTGGKAILHTDELTYSLALPASDEIAAGGIIESYRRISQALLAGLENLGLQSQADKKADDVKLTGAVCFESPSHYEITTSGGRKLIGSAQTRRKDGLLQHGTLPLCGDVARICDSLRYPDEQTRDIAKNNVRMRAATLADALGEEVDWHSAAEALAKGFIETFDVDFTVVDLSAAQRATAMQLAADVYRTDAWNKRL